MHISRMLGVRYEAKRRTGPYTAGVEGDGDGLNVLGVQTLLELLREEDVCQLRQT